MYIRTAVARLYTFAYAIHLVWYNCMHVGYEETSLPVDIRLADCLRVALLLLIVDNARSGIVGNCRSL